MKHNKPVKPIEMKQGDLTLNVEYFRDNMNWICELLHKLDIDMTNPEKPKIVPRYI